MKQLPLFLSLVMFLLVSCSQDFIKTNDDQETTTVKMSLRTADQVVEGSSVRSANPQTVDDSGVDNIWVLQFVDGVFTKKNYVTSVNLNELELELVTNENGKTSNIYFVANVGSSAFATDPTSEASYKTMTMPVTSEASCLKPGSSKNVIPMSGRALNVVVKSADIAIGGILYRMLARMEYTYSVDSTLAFQVAKIRLCGIPKAIQYDSIVSVNYPADGDTTQTFEYEVAPHATTATPNTMIFYVPDNRRGTGTNMALSDDRLKLGLAGATSIQLVGYTTGPNGGDEITYTLYPGGDAYNDYNIKRNTVYKRSSNIKSILPRTDARLKLTETSNCYIVYPGDSVSIPVKRANCSDLGTQLPDVTKDWTASIYWQTEAGLITVKSEVATGRFTVVAPSASAKGNAVVVVKNAANEIVWSWHIWVVKYNPEKENETQNNNVWMSRNLGATELADGTITFKTCGGLYYQWGRNNPFPGNNGLVATSVLSIYGTTSSTALTSDSISWPTVGSPTATGSNNDVVKYATLGATPTTEIPFANQLAYSVKYPLLFLKYWAGSTATTAAAYTVVGGMSSWGGEYGEAKSVYDPCPAGWRVPSGRKASSTYSFPYSTWNSAPIFTTTLFAALKWGGVGTYFYPAVRNRSNIGALQSVGQGLYLTNASINGVNVNTVIISSNHLNISTTMREYGYALRCVKEW